VMEHFAGLHIIEIEVTPSSDELDWSEITQRIAGAPRSNWQVPYDQRALNDDGTRWAFFFHYLDCQTPLLTPRGAARLPDVTPLPKYLQAIEYEAP